MVGTLSQSWDHLTYHSLSARDLHVTFFGLRSYTASCGSDKTFVSAGLLPALLVLLQHPLSLLLPSLSSVHDILKISLVNANGAFLPELRRAARSLLDKGPPRPSSLFVSSRHSSSPLTSSFTNNLSAVLTRHENHEVSSFGRRRPRGHSQAGPNPH